MSVKQAMKGESSILISKWSNSAPVRQQTEIGFGMTESNLPVFSAACRLTPSPVEESNGSVKRVRPAHPVAQRVFPIRTLVPACRIFDGNPLNESGFVMPVTDRLVEAPCFIEEKTFFAARGSTKLAEEISLGQVHGFECGV